MGHEADLIFSSLELFFFTKEKGLGKEGKRIIFLLRTKDKWANDWNKKRVLLSRVRRKTKRDSLMVFPT